MTSNSLQKNKNNNINQNTSSALFINLESIKANYNLLKKIANKSEVAVAVKANAYGLGFQKICKTLISQGCKTFFVANAEEGLEIIKIKKNLNIYVLNGSSNKKSCNPSCGPWYANAPGYESNTKGAFASIRPTDH